MPWSFTSEGVTVSSETTPPLTNLSVSSSNYVWLTSKTFIEVIWGSSPQWQGWHRAHQELARHGHAVLEFTYRGIAREGHVFSHARAKPVIIPELPGDRERTNRLSLVAHGGWEESTTAGIVRQTTGRWSRFDAVD